MSSVTEDFFAQSCEFNYEDGRACELGISGSVRKSLGRGVLKQRMKV